MQCPFCKTDNDRVIDSRKGPDGVSIRRRRECMECGRRFTTYERVEKQHLMVIKKGGERVPYERNKCMNGILKACWKRPVSMERVESLLNEIEARMEEEAVNGEISSSRIGEMVMEGLKSIDHIAYVRFASVYRDFKDAEDFMRELKRLLETR